MSVSPIPKGYQSVIPYLSVPGAEKFVEFLKKTFDAKSGDLVKGDEGKIMHAEVRIGDCVVMLSDSTPQYPATSVNLYVYVEDVDKVYKRALEAGAESIMEPQNQFYGDRSGGVKDGFGNQWWIATHVEEVSPEEMQRREEEWKKNKEKK